MIDGAHIGERLKAIRTLRGETLRSVEAATGVSNALISQIESGHVRNPGLLTIAPVAAYYGITVDSLLTNGSD